jgi:hypothetical protein
MILKTNKTFTKGSRQEKLEIQWMRIKLENIILRMIKLKINKTSTKKPIPKIKNQKNKDWSWNTSN